MWPAQVLPPVLFLCRLLARALPAEVPDQHQAVLAPRDKVAVVTRELQARHVLVVTGEDDQEVPSGDLGWARQQSGVTEPCLPALGLWSMEQGTGPGLAVSPVSDGSVTPPGKGDISFLGPLSPQGSLSLIMSKVG